MKKLEAQNINFDNADDRKNVNGTKIPCTYSPVNYAPEAVAGEALTMLSAHLKGIDERLAELGSAAANFIDQVFPTDGIEVDYQVSNPFDGSSKIDVYEQGVLKEEFDDWTRDSDLNKITSDIVIPSGINYRTRVYNQGFGHTDEFFTGDDVVTDFFPTASFDAATKIDVFLNGALGKEDTDWEREEGTGRISVLDYAGVKMALPAPSRMRVRIHNVSFSDEHFTGGQDNLPIATNFESSTKIDVFINGRLGVEGTDWTKNAGANTVAIVDGSTAMAGNTFIRVRIWP